jgi:thymidylate synthase
MIVYTILRPMFRVLEGHTADELWLKAAAWFGPGGVAAQQSSRCGDTAEILHAALSLSDPRQRWIASRSPAMNPAFALAEVIWIVSGRNDSAFLNYYNRKLPDFAGKGPTYHGAYGFRLRKHLGLDQLERAYRCLSSEAKSRQVVLQIWDGEADLPNDNGVPRSQDIPCNVISLLKIRDGRLEWTQIMRSNDLILGVPHNIVQFTSLQEIMAGWLGVEMGGYHHFADSLHLYDRDAPISTRVDPQDLPRNEESVALSKEESDRSFEVLSRLGDVLVSPSTDVASAALAFNEVDLNPSFRSWAALLTADALRRRGARKEFEEVMTVCSNFCLVKMFERWLSRCSGTR